MRLVAFAFAGVVFRRTWRRAGSLVLSGALVCLVGLYHAAAALFSELGADYARDALTNLVGRVGAWLVIAGVLAIYALNWRRRRASAANPICARARRRTPAPSRARFIRMRHPRLGRSGAARRDWMCDVWR